MNISLTPELEHLIDQKVKSGMYNSASEVVREALRLFMERDQLKQMKLDDLRNQIQIGIDAADRGELLSEDQVLQRLDTGRNKALAKKSKKS